MNNNKYFTLETEARKQFYQVPKQFMKKESKYFAMSSDAKLLYGVLSDRNSLSISNGWIDEENRVYFIATIDALMELTGWGNQKVTKHLKELRKFDLLISEQKGQGNPSWHYLLQIDVEEGLESQSYQQKCENHISRNVKITSQEMLKSHANNTDINNTDINNTDIYLSKKTDNTKNYCKTESKDIVDGKIDDLMEFTMGSYSKLDLKKFLNAGDGHVELVKYVYDNVMKNISMAIDKEPIRNLVQYIVKAIENENNS